MKYFSFCILVLGLVACSDEVVEVSESSTKVISVEAKEPFEEKATEQKDIREKVWEQLSKTDQDRINGTWSDGAIMKRVLREGMGNVKDSSYYGREIFIIDFPIKSTTSLRNMVVFADLHTQKIIGYGYLD
jgi:hypothetical protein